MCERERERACQINTRTHRLCLYAGHHCEFHTKRQICESLCLHKRRMNKRLAVEFNVLRYRADILGTN